MRDNWALLHAIEQAGKTGAPVAVVFNLVCSLGFWDAMTDCTPPACVVQHLRTVLT